MCRNSRSFHLAEIHVKMFTIYKHALLIERLSKHYLLYGPSEIISTSDKEKDFIRFHNIHKAYNI